MQSICIQLLDICHSQLVLGNWNQFRYNLIHITNVHIKNKKTERAVGAQYIVSAVHSTFAFFFLLITLSFKSWGRAPSSLLLAVHSFASLDTAIPIYIYRERESK